MQWLDVIKALISLVAGIVTFLRERKLIEAGAAQAIAAALEQADNEIKNAKAARARVSAELDAHPERLRDPDEFQRPPEGGAARDSTTNRDDRP